MPHFKSHLVLQISRRLKAFLNLDVGITRGEVPANPGALDTASKQPESSVERLQAQIKRQRQQITELRDQLDSTKPSGVVGATANHSASRNDFRPVERSEVFRSLLKPMKPGRMLELGTGSDEALTVARDLGWEVTTERVPDQGDSGVPRFDSRKDHDCICILDVFDRLKLAEQIELLEQCAGTATIIDTHVSMEPVYEELGYGGHLHRDDTAESGAVTEGTHSFWPSEKSLVRMVHDSGFHTVFKLEPYHAPDRTFYLCL